MITRTNFHSSKLIRCLADLAIVEAVEPGNAFAEKLGQWIHFTDAIPLSAVHKDSIASLPKLHPEAQFLARVAPGIEFDRIQVILTNSIMKSCSANLSKIHTRFPTIKFELPMNFAAAYAPYHQFYDTHQRDMELSIQPLRINVRNALAKASPRLKKLADLDLVFERILQKRDKKLLATMPVLLKKRFEQLFRGHQKMLVDTQQVDNPVGWTEAGAWLVRFCDDMQTLLLAELELRLQPTLGLIEAFNNEIRNE